MRQTLSSVDGKPDQAGISPGHLQRCTKGQRCGTSQSLRKKRRMKSETLWRDPNWAKQYFPIPDDLFVLAHSSAPAARSTDPHPPATVRRPKKRDLHRSDPRIESCRMRGDPQAQWPVLFSVAVVTFRRSVPAILFNESSIPPPWRPV